MLKTIINYVYYNYQLCENIDSPFLLSDINANECFIKSCLVYKNLHEIYGRGNISLQEVMMIMDVTDFLFMPNSPVLKNHLIFHQSFKTFWKRHKKGRREIYVFDTTIRSSCLGFVTGVAVSSVRRLKANVLILLEHINLSSSLGESATLFTVVEYMS